MNTDKLCALSRAVDAAICWALAPKWCRGKLVARVKHAYRHEGEQSKTDRSACVYA
jgi:hypothetical protein